MNETNFTIEARPLDISQDEINRRWNRVFDILLTAAASEDEPCSVGDETSSAEQPEQQTIELSKADESTSLSTDER